MGPGQANTAVESDFSLDIYFKGGTEGPRMVNALKDLVKRQSNAVTSITYV